MPLVAGFNQEVSFGGILQLFDSSVYHVLLQGFHAPLAQITIERTINIFAFLDFAKLNSSTVSWRQEAIHTLQNLSIFGSTLDVQPDDQLLLLITCVDNDDDRRIIAARRVREDENEEHLRSVGCQIAASVPY